MLPKPDQSLIEFKEEPAKTVAAISFNGWANDKKIEKFKQELKSALEAEGITYSDRFYFLGYNAPYEVFNRKNEVIVELKINTSGVNVRPTYYVRTGTPTFMIANRVSQIDGGTITGMELDTNDIAIMRFQVNDIGSIEGLMLLGAVQMVNA